MQSLHARSNEIAALPADFGKLTLLHLLDLAENKLAALPDSMAGMASLQALKLSRNQIAALPDALFAAGLEALLDVDLSHNRLAALPADLSALGSLMFFNANMNRLTAVPDALGSLANLQDLHVAGNQLEALPDISQVRSLIVASLSSSAATVHLRPSSMPPTIAV